MFDFPLDDAIASLSRREPAVAGLHVDKFDRLDAAFRRKALKYR